MNVRFSKNEIRLRLSEEEFATLKDTGELCEALDLGAHRFYCTLYRSGEQAGRVVVSSTGLQVHCPAIEDFTFQLPECETRVKLEVDLFSLGRGGHG